MKKTKGKPKSKAKHKAKGKSRTKKITRRIHKETPAQEPQTQQEPAELGEFHDPDEPNEIREGFEEQEREEFPAAQGSRVPGDAQEA